ncbi:MAG: VTT domain-containing protein, partial [Actinomadura rubrobrunea]|nr:VTT domain-containing protein [Actinomadura rubrobrunea]
MRDFLLGMPLWAAVVASVLIIFARGQAYYWIGRGVGPRVYASRAGRRIGERRLRRVERLVARRGAVAVFAAHWVAGFRHAIPVCAGVTRMPIPRYLLASALGSLLWTPPWVVGGYAVVWGWLK